VIVRRPALWIEARTRHAVGSEATSPNSAGWSRSVARSLKVSPPPGEHDGELGEHDTWVVASLAFDDMGHPFGERPSHIQKIGEFGKQ
jgi:hypothetical protein